jgi:hypothetical protein
VIEDNLYIDGEIGMSIGGNDKIAPYRFKNMTVRDNVLLDIGRSRPTNRDLGWCIDINDWDGGKVTRNLCVHQPSTAVKNVHAFDIKGDTRNVIVEGNVVHGLHKGSEYKNQALLNLSDGEAKLNVSFIGNLFQSHAYGALLVNARGSLANYTFKDNVYYSASAPDKWFRIGPNSGELAAWRRASGETGMAKKVQFPDPTRSIETYQKSLGRTATIDAFIEEVRAQSKYRWRPEYTAGAVNRWMRAGFLK